MTITVEDLMSTALLTVRDTDSLADARNTMNAAGIRHLPVSDSKNHVVGMLSHRDVGSRTRGKRVGAVMSRDVKTVRPQAPAHLAAELMLDCKFGALPVVDEDEHLVGIVTETDFLRIAAQALAKRV